MLQFFTKNFKKIQLEVDKNAILCSDLAMFKITFIRRSEERFANPTYYSKESAVLYFPSSHSGSEMPFRRYSVIVGLVIQHADITSGQENP